MSGYRLSLSGQRNGLAKDDWQDWNAACYGSNGLDGVCSCSWNERRGCCIGVGSYWGGLNRSGCGSISSYGRDGWQSFCGGSPSRGCNSGNRRSGRIRGGRSDGWQYGSASVSHSRLNGRSNGRSSVRSAWRCCCDGLDGGRCGCLCARLARCGCYDARRCRLCSRNLTIRDDWLDRNDIRIRRRRRRLRSRSSDGLCTLARGRPRRQEQRQILGCLTTSQARHAALARWDSTTPWRREGREQRREVVSVDVEGLQRLWMTRHDARVELVRRELHVRAQADRGQCRARSGGRGDNYELLSCRARSRLRRCLGSGNGDGVRVQRGLRCSYARCQCGNVRIGNSGGGDAAGVDVGRGETAGQRLGYHQGTRAGDGRARGRKHHGEQNGRDEGRPETSLALLLLCVGHVVG